MRALWIIGPALALASCGGLTKAVEVRTIEVPVPQPCLALSEIPAEPGRVNDLLSGDAEADANLLGASALELRAWGQKMHAALVACAMTPGA